MSFHQRQVKHGYPVFCDTWSESAVFFVALTVREKIGAIATPDYIQNAPGLPKTRSGNVIFPPS